MTEILELEPHNHAFSGFLDPNALPPAEPMAMGFMGVTEKAKVWFRGGYTCTCVAISLPWVEYDMLRKGLIKNNIDIWQLGYRGDVAASAGTHNGGGNTDVDQYNAACIKVWRNWGWTIQHRTRSQGFDMDHGHGWPFGCPHLSAGGRHQATQWKNGTNGLVSYGPIAGPWPVSGWKTALERNFYKMFTLADIRDAMSKVLKDNLDNIAKAVLTNDTIPNDFTGNPDNKFVSPTTALSYTGKKLNSHEERLVALEAALAEIKSGQTEVVNSNREVLDAFNKSV